MTVREHMCLTIAAATYRYPGRRDTDMLEHVGMTPARAAQVVNALLDRPDVEAEMPVEVHRLRRVRDARRQARRPQPRQAG